MNTEQNSNKSEKALCIGSVICSTLPKLTELTYYPFKDGKNIIDTNGNKYYYFELIKAGYSTMDLHTVNRVYCN